MAALEGAPRPGPKGRTLSTLIHLPITKTHWIIDNLLPYKSRVLLYGEWGVGKSFFLADMALHVAAGKPWLGFSIPAPLVVAYHDEEMTDDIVVPRMRALVAGGAIPETAPFYHYTHTNLVSDGNLHGRLKALWQHDGITPQLVILETARELLGLQDEKEATVVRNLWKQLRPIVDTGATVILTHHKRKPSLDKHGSLQGATRDTASGSQDWLAGADWALACSRTPEEGITRVSYEKCRQIKPPAPWLFTIRGDADTGIMSLSVVQRPIQEEAAKPAQQYVLKRPTLEEEYDTPE